MGRTYKEDTNILHCKLDENIGKMLIEFCKETGLPKTTTVEWALKFYFERYKEKGMI